MTFIPLHRYSDNKELYINANRIMIMFEDEKSSTVVFDNESSVYIKESVREILTMIPRNIP